MQDGGGGFVATGAGSSTISERSRSGGWQRGVQSRSARIEGRNFNRNGEAGYRGNIAVTRAGSNGAGKRLRIPAGRGGGTAAGGVRYPGDSANRGHDEDGGGSARTVRRSCQRQFEIVRKRRRNFVVFRRGGVTKLSVSLLKKSVHDLLFLAHKFLAFFQAIRLTLDVDNGAVM